MRFKARDEDDARAIAFEKASPDGSAGPFRALVRVDDESGTYEVRDIPEALDLEALGGDTEALCEGAALSDLRNDEELICLVWADDDIGGNADS